MSLHHTPKPLLIACGILQPEIEALIAKGEIDAQALFLNKHLHEDYQKLQKALQASLHKHAPRKPVVVYGDLCLGFKGEMQALMRECQTVKVEALNCIDCLLGGKQRLLEIDPDHKIYFLTPAFLEFSEKLLSGNPETDQACFNMLRGIILLDSLGDLNRYQDRIRNFSRQIGLPVLEHRNVGIEGLKALILEALQRSSHERAHQINANLPTG